MPPTGKTSFARPAGGAPAPAAPVQRSGPPPPRRPAAPAPRAAVTPTDPTPRAPSAPPRRAAPVAQAHEPEEVQAHEPEEVQAHEPEEVQAHEPEEVQAPEIKTEVLPPEEGQPVEVEQVRADAVPPRRGRGPNKPKPVAAPHTGLAVRSEQPLAMAGGSPGLPRVGETRGEVDASDLQLPQFKIANATGPLSLLDPPVPPGTLVVGAGGQWAYLWQDGCEPVEATIIWSDKGFAQKNDINGQSLFDLEEQGLTFWGPNAKIDMQNSNGSLSEIPGTLLFAPIMMAQMLIRMPAGVEDDYGLFSLEIPGVDGLFMVAVFYIRGSSYQECARKIINEKGKFYQDGEIHKVNWLIEGKRIVGKKNAWYVPTLTNGSENQDEIVQFLETNG